MTTTNSTEGEASPSLLGNQDGSWIGKVDCLPVTEYVQANARLGQFLGEDLPYLIQVAGFGFELCSKWSTSNSRA